MINAHSRRSWLRAVGLSSLGAALVPWLESTEASASEPIPPQRLVLFYNPNGTVPSAWTPKDRKSETDWRLNFIHEPLAAFRDRVSVFEGLDNLVALDTGNHGGPHQRGIGALFTGERLQTGAFADGCGSTAGWANGPSLDQIVAQLIGGKTALGSLELGVHSLDNDVQGCISYAGPGKPLLPQSSPEIAFRQVFGNFATTPDGKREAVRGWVSDYVHSQFRGLSRRVSKSDSLRLQAHESLLFELESRLKIARPACQLPTAPPPLNEADENLQNEISQAQLDLLALCLSCDLTRVGSVQYSSGFNKLRFPQLDTLGEGHLLSHSGDSNVAAWDGLAKRAQWHAKQIAYLAEKLSAQTEGAGSILDNTLIVWGNEVQKGNSHALTNIPLLTLGNLGGKLRGGRAFTYENRSHTDLLTTIAYAYGSTAGAVGLKDYSGGLLENFLA